MTDQFLHGVRVVNIDNGARPISVAASSVIGIVGTAPMAADDALPLNTPTLVTSAGEAALLTGAEPGAENAGTLPGALASIYAQAAAVVVVIRVQDEADEQETLANVVGGVNAQTGAYEGVHAFLAAKSVTGVKPRILIAPGFTGEHLVEEGGDFLANAAVAEMEGIADRMRAIIVKDGPNTTDADAIATAALSGSARVYCVDPAVLVQEGADIVSRPASATVAGAIARSDNARGWWASPSNLELFGILGTARPIDFALSDATSRANLLNESNVATIVREGGFRLWGNRTTSADPKFQFLSTIRTADIIADSLEEAHLWAVDRGITKTYAEDVREGVSAFLRGLVAQGAILGGDCWINPDLNTPANIAQGRFYWDFDFTPTYPAEQLTFRAHMVNDYISEIF